MRAAVTATQGAPSLDLTTCLRAIGVDRTAHLLTQTPAQRQTAAVRVQAQMRYAVLVVDDVSARELGALQQWGARVDLDVVRETLGPVFGSIAAAGATADAVVAGHEGTIAGA